MPRRVEVFGVYAWPTPRAGHSDTPMEAVRSLVLGSRCCAPAVPARHSRSPPVACLSRPPDFVKGGCPCGGRGPMNVRQLSRHRASPGSVPAGVPENFYR